MLVVLMYHRVTKTPFFYQEGAFERHLTDLSQRYPILIPGEKLHKNKINICLTFDDAYFDFYQEVFPLLQKLDLRAVLAIPAGLILENTKLDNQTRLQMPYAEALKAYKTQASLCTWEEIKRMTATPHVIPAAHGLTHQHLTQPGLSLEQEIVDAKIMLEEKTQQDVDTFVYPYGTMTRPINRQVNQHYRYAMRIGSALNRSWQNQHQVIYRVNAEAFWPQGKALFTTGHKLSLGLRYLSNTLRFK